MNSDTFTSSKSFASSVGAAVSVPRHGIHLTPRESEIVRYVLMGESNKQIARRLGISNYTVRDHVSNLLKKSGVTSRTRLALVLPASTVQPVTAALRAG